MATQDSWNYLDNYLNSIDSTETPYADTQRSFLGDLGSAAYRGIIGAGELASGIGKVVTGDYEKNSVDSFLEQRMKDEFAKPDIDQYLGEDGYLKQFVLGAVESTPSSILGTGTTLGLAATGVGAPAAIALGTLVTAATFGPGTYGKEKSDALAKGLDETTASDLALKNSLWEVGSEIPGMIVGARGINSIFKNSVKQLTEAGLDVTVKNLSKALTTKQAVLNVLGHLGETATFEGGAEALTGYNQAVNSNEAYGLTEGMPGYQDPKEAAIQGFGSGIVMGTVFGGATAGMNAIQRNTLQKALQSDNKDIQAQAAKVIADNLEEGEAKSQWKTYSDTVLNTPGLKFDLNAAFVKIGQDIKKYADSAYITPELIVKGGDALKTAVNTELKSKEFPTVFGGQPLVSTDNTTLKGELAQQKLTESFLAPPKEATVSTPLVPASEMARQQQEEINKATTKEAQKVQDYLAIGAGGKDTTGVLPTKEVKETKVTPIAPVRDLVNEIQKKIVDGETVTKAEIELVNSYTRGDFNNEAPVSEEEFFKDLNAAPKVTQPTTENTNAKETKTLPKVQDANPQLQVQEGKEVTPKVIPNISGGTPTIAPVVTPALESNKTVTPTTKVKQKKAKVETPVTTVATETKLVETPASTAEDTQVLPTTETPVAGTEVSVEPAPIGTSETKETPKVITVEERIAKTIDSLKAMKKRGDVSVVQIPSSESVENYIAKEGLSREEADINSIVNILSELHKDIYDTYENYKPEVKKEIPKTTTPTVIRRKASEVKSKEVTPVEEATAAEPLTEDEQERMMDYVDMLRTDGSLSPKFQKDLDELRAKDKAYRESKRVEVTPKQETIDENIKELEETLVTKEKELDEIDKLHRSAVKSGNEKLASIKEKQFSKKLQEVNEVKTKIDLANRRKERSLSSEMKRVETSGDRVKHEGGIAGETGKVRNPTVTANMTDESSINYQETSKGDLEEETTHLQQDEEGYTKADVIPVAAKESEDFPGLYEMSRRHAIDWWGYDKNAKGNASIQIAGDNPNTSPLTIMNVRDSSEDTSTTRRWILITTPRDGKKSVTYTKHPITGKIFESDQVKQFAKDLLSGKYTAKQLKSAEISESDKLGDYTETKIAGVPTEKTARDILDTVIANGGVAGKLASILKSVARKEYLDTKVIYDPDVEYSNYDWQSNILTLSNNSSKVKLHEVVHALTVRAMKSNPTLQKYGKRITDHLGAMIVRKGIVTSEQLAASKLLKGVAYRDYVEGLGLSYGDQQLVYAAYNEFEMISQAVSSPYVQDFMSKIPASERMKESTLANFIKTTWDQVKNLVSNALGLKSGQWNLLSEVLSFTAEVSSAKTNTNALEAKYHEYSKSGFYLNAELATKDDIFEKVRLEQLATAKFLRRNGVDAIDISAATNMFYDINDKNWKYETDDLGVSLIRPITKEEVTLGDVLDAKDLFGKFPELKEIKVQGYNTSNIEEQGYVSKGKIFVNVANKDSLSTIVHEVQHIIQELQGLGKGSNPDTVLDTIELMSLRGKGIDTIKSGILDVSENLEAELEDTDLDLSTLKFDTEDVEEFFTDVANKITEYISKGFPLNKAISIAKIYVTSLDSPISETNIDKLFDIKQVLNVLNTGSFDINSFRKTLEDTRSYIKQEIKYVDDIIDNDFDKNKVKNLVSYARTYTSRLGDTLYVLYRNVAGEVEARDVEARLKMTKEERKATRPAVARQRGLLRAKSTSTTAKSVETQTNVSDIIAQTSTDMQAKEKLSSKASTFLEGTKNILQNLLQNTIYRIKHISKAIGERVEKFEADWNIWNRKYYDRAAKFVNWYYGLSPDLRAAIKVAILQPDTKEGNRIKEEIYAKPEFQDINVEGSKTARELVSRIQKEIFEPIQLEALKRGLLDEKQLISDYWHSQIKDMDGYISWKIDHMKEKGTIEDRHDAIFQHVIETKEAELGRKLTDEEKAEIITTLIRSGKLYAFKIPSSLKERITKGIHKEAYKFYADPVETLLQHINEMNKAIAVEDMIGGGKLRSAMNTEIAKIISKIDKGNATEADKIRLSVLQERLTNKTYMIENSVAGLLELQSRDKNKPDSEIQKERKEVIELIRAIVNEQGLHGSLAKFKNITLATSIGNIGSSITQLGDIVFPVFFGKSTNLPPAIAKMMASGKANRLVNNFDLEKMYTDFSESGTTTGMLNRILKVTGFTMMDAFGKELFLRTQQQMLSNMTETEFINKFQGYYEDEQILKDAYKAIKDDKVEDNHAAKVLLLVQLSKAQPIFTSALPKSALEAGNMRIFYMLKTFAIHALNNVVNEIQTSINEGNKLEGTERYKKYFEGFSKAAGLTFLLVVAGATTDEIKDFFSGRDKDLSDRLMDNLWRIFLLNRYAMEKGIESGKPVDAIAGAALMPPLRFYNNLATDMWNLLRLDPSYKTLANVPLIGQQVYSQLTPAGALDKAKAYKAAMAKETNPDAIRRAVVRYNKALADIDPQTRKEKELKPAKVSEVIKRRREQEKKK